MAIPAVRFVAHPEGSDVETNQGSFVPKGAPNVGTGNWWWYYVPCENGLWLLLKVEIPGTILGMQTAEIVNDAQITATLASGILNISLVHVDEIKHTAELSERSRRAAISLLVV